MDLCIYLVHPFLHSGISSIVITDSFVTNSFQRSEIACHFLKRIHIGVLNADSYESLSIVRRFYHSLRKSSAAIRGFGKRSQQVISIFDSFDQVSLFANELQRVLKLEKLSLKRIVGGHHDIFVNVKKEGKYKTLRVMLAENNHVKIQPMQQKQLTNGGIKASQLCGSRLVPDEEMVVFCLFSRSSSCGWTCMLKMQKGSEIHDGRLQDQYILRSIPDASKSPFVTLMLRQLFNNQSEYMVDNVISVFFCSDAI